jgi:integrase
MARPKSPLEFRTARLKLESRRKPYFDVISPGVSLGYRRTTTAGTWVLRAADGAGSSWTRRIAIADDFESANGSSVLSYAEALDKARELARGGSGAGKIASVADALDAYAADLRARGALPGNASRVRTNLPPALLAKSVALLGGREIRSWRDGLLARGMAPGSVDRNVIALKAALNLAARDDTRIRNASAWKLPRLPDSEPTFVHAILSIEEIGKIVRAAYTLDPAFGRIVEVLAETGARASQVVRLQVEDLQLNPPRLMMPTSRKGRQRRAEKRPVPISEGLAQRLRRNITKGPLLVNGAGDAWRPNKIPDRFPLLKAGEGVTAYSLRHSSIVRQLLAGIPVRVVASGHDSSVAMLEKTYSRFISDHADSLTRSTLPVFGS